MTNQPWLDSVRRQLAANNLPPTYIRRFMEELTDHCNDITEENMNSENNVVSRLGEPQQIADAAICTFRRRSFLGRHPSAALAFFGITPLAALLSLFALAFACLYGVCTACEHLGFKLNGIKQFEPAASAVLPYVLSLLMVIVPACLASLFYGKLIMRLGISRRWIVLSSLALAIVAIAPIWTITLSDQPGQSDLRCIVVIPQDTGNIVHHYLCSFRQLLQFAAPLLVGLWFLRRRRQEIHDEDELRLAA
jgi:hypothetical protein